MEQVLPVGSIIEGRYEIISLAGEGGMGSVFRARHLELGRFVAIKTLDPMLVSHPELFARFKREARILASMTHPHICLFYSFEILESGMPYIAMEFIDGKSLAQLVNEDDQLKPERVLKIAIDVCEAMEYAHNAGIIHRDLKPQNILLLSEPEPDYVKILDFGLARLVPSSIGDDQKQKLTQTGALIGTPDYLSPEQCMGRPADQRSDIYALGCVVFKILSGTAPFEADTPVGLLSKHLHDTPKFPSSVANNLPPGLELVILKSLEKDPEKRQQSMTEFRNELQLVADGKSTELDISLSPEATAQLAVRGELPKTGILAALALVIVIGCAVLLFQNLQVRIPKNGNDSAKGFDVLLKNIEDKHDGTKESDTTSLKELENKLHLEEKDPIKRAELSCKVAESFQSKNMYPEAGRFALLVFNDVSAARPTYGGHRYVAGPGEQMIGRFMSTSKLKKESKLYFTNAPELVDLDAARRQAIQVLERASKILLLVNYPGDRKLWQKCSTYVINYKSDVNLDTSYMADILVNAYKTGAIPISQEVIYAMYAREKSLLLHHKEKEFDQQNAETSKAHEKFFGKDTANIPMHLFTLGSEELVIHAGYGEKLFNEGMKFLNSRPQAKSDSLSTRMYLVGSQLALKLKKNAEALRLAKLAESTFSDELSRTTLGQVYEQLAASCFELGQYPDAIKFAHKAFETLAPVEDIQYPRSEAASTHARALVRMGKVAKGRKVIDDELEFLKNNLPMSTSRLISLQSSFIACLDEQHDYKAARYYSRELLRTCDAIFERNPQRATHLSGQFIPRWMRFEQELYNNGKTEGADELLATRTAYWRRLLIVNPTICPEWYQFYKSKNEESICTRIKVKIQQICSTELASKAPDEAVLAGGIRFFRDTGFTSESEELKKRSLAILGETKRTLMLQKL